MGWTEYHAQYYKNGKVDRKAELDSGFNSNNYKVIKSTMVGSTYYGAIEHGDSIFATIILTGTRDREYWFAYKDMDETELPYNYDCPKSILDLLTPTDNKWANEWRKRCYNHLAKKKDLANLSVGTMISVPWDSNTGEIILTKRHEKGRTAWQSGYSYMNKSTILRQGFRVITKEYLDAEHQCYDYLCKYLICVQKNLPYSTAWLSLATGLKDRYAINEQWFKNKLYDASEIASYYVNSKIA